MTAAILSSPAFKEHVADGYHPERPERLGAVLQGLSSSGTLRSAKQLPAREATAEELGRVHEPRYVEGTLRSLAARAEGYLDADTFFSPGTRAAALLAAGGGIDLVRAVHRREADWGWAAVRPPGHHASWGSAAGFCIFNNIAVAAAALRASGDAERVAIFDWDVHHGNGTQDQFWDEPDVLFVSVHQRPHYPGSGLVGEIGGAGALGRVVNFPYPAGAGDADYLSVIDSVFAPLVRAHRPDHILVSAGFDAHERDPLGGMRVTTDGYAAMAGRLRDLAAQTCGGRLTLFLEGGYDLQALADATAAVSAVLDGATAPEIDTGGTSRGCRAVLEAVVEQIAPRWPGAGLGADRR